MYTDSIRGHLGALSAVRLRGCPQSTTNTCTWTCLDCLDQVKQLPFADVSDFDTSGSSVDINEERDTQLDIWSSFDAMANKRRANTKIGHINANNIAGFKFFEIRSWLMSGRFNILLITETKIDATFSNSQFNVNGFRMYRVDVAHSGGMMIFIRNDICFHVVTRFNIDMSSFRTESMLLKVKINKSWFAIVGIYRPPNIPKVSGNVNLVPFLKMQQQFQMTLFSHHQLERQKKQQQSRSHSYKQQEKNTIIGRA